MADSPTAYLRIQQTKVLSHEVFEGGSIFLRSSAYPSLLVLRLPSLGINVPPLRLDLSMLRVDVAVEHRSTRLIEQFEPCHSGRDNCGVVALPCRNRSHWRSNEMATEFHEGVNHAHPASRRWSEVQSNPASPGAPFLLETLCKSKSPKDLVWWAKWRLWDNPMARRHIDYYLKGTGQDFNEDAALKIALEKDDGVRSAIGRRLPKGKTSGKFSEAFKLEQAHYGLTDFRTSWGAIDIFDFEADFDAQTIHVWFKDRYEWHPIYPGLYSACHDPSSRNTNCLHAAFVEMKTEGAADFWMVGDATVSLKGFPISGPGTTNVPDWVIPGVE